MMNKCTFIGNLGDDPEIRHTQSGEAVANIRLAVSEKWKDKQGQKQERTEWVRVVFFGKLAEIAETYLRKGSQAYVEGKMQTKKWQDRDGNDRYTTEIVGREMVMLGGKGERKDAAPTETVAQGEFDDLEDAPF